MYLVTIIPTLDRADFLRKSIISIIKQNRKPDKVIIINNNKKSNINREIFNEFKNNLNLEYLDDFSPITQIRNTAAFETDGDLIAFLDDDDQWHQDYISKSIDLFEKKNLDALYTSYDLVDLNEKKLSEINLKDDYNIDEVLVYNPGFLTSNVIIKKKVFEKLKGFNSKFGSADKDLFIRLKEQSYKFYINPERLVIRTEHSNQLSKDYKLIFYDKIKFFYNNFRKLNFKNKAIYIKSSLAIFYKFLRKLLNK